MDFASSEAHRAVGAIAHQAFHHVQDPAIGRVVADRRRGWWSGCPRVRKSVGRGMRRARGNEKAAAKAARSGGMGYAGLLRALRFGQYWRQIRALESPPAA